MTKEIFIPQDDRTRPVTINLYEAERKRGAAAADLMPYALHDAANVFLFIHEGLSLGHIDAANAGLISLTNICAQHFRQLAESEGEHLAQLAMRLADPTPANGKKEQS